jgi:hypothetical protein
MSNNESRKPWQDDIIKWEYDSARLKEKIYKETIKSISKDASSKAYLKQYQNTESTIQFYAWQKASWVVDKERSEWTLDNRSNRDLLDAQTCLGNIQQKKLFDKQCLWRAEMFTHPAIETTQDFGYWEHNILNCPFIDPITQDDIALYIEFLKEYLGEDLMFLGSWQDYNSYNSSYATVGKVMNKPKPNDEDDEEEEDDDEDEDDINSLLPPWYQFVNEQKGDSHYLMLKDVRQEKEWKYSRIGHAEESRIYAEKLKKSPIDTRPFLSVSREEEMINFINIIEDNPEEIIKAYKVHRELYNKPEQDDMYEVEEAWDNLEDCYEPFPIAEGITDWKEALIATAKQWTNTKIIRNLPIFYEDYLFRNANGIKNVINEENERCYRKMADNYKESILLGRELSGEPRDLNF